MSGAPIRLAELMVALSFATDLGMGQPTDFAAQSCVLAMRLADRAGYDQAARTATYYQALLRYIGCNAETEAIAAVVGDELAFRADFATIDAAAPGQVIPLLVRHIRRVGADRPRLAVLSAMLSGMMAMRRVEHEVLPGHCEVAQRLAQRLGFASDLTEGLGQLYARWDGRGIPRVKGAAIAPATRAVCLAQDMVVWHRLGGVAAARATARRRRGRQYDPALVDCLLPMADSWLGEARPDPGTVLALEPGEPIRLDATGFDVACQAMADFADIKSTWTLGHSSRVAALAHAAALIAGFAPDAAATLRRAGWLHDLGRVGVSAGIWAKPAGLSAREHESVRLHSYYTERILAQAPGLAALARLAGAAHERLDGGGYHRGAAARDLSMAARLLAVADAYAAMTEARPHRAALTPADAAATLTAEARGGRHDPAAVEAVLAAAGQGAPPVPHALRAGLTEREVEVLALLARGRSNKMIARALGVAPKTVDNHVQRIYAKAGVTTRAGATLFAMEHRLLSP